MTHNIVTTVEKWHQKTSGKDFAQGSFKPDPEIFNRVEFRGIRGREQQPAPGILGSRKQPFFGMERDAVYYNHCAFIQGMVEADWKTRSQKGCCPSSRYIETARESYPSF